MKKILVVEDAQALRRDIMEMLGYEGYDVQGAENGLVGVECARGYNPDLIICDIMMPGLDGFGVLNELRKEAATATIPFIFLTARTERGDVRQGMEMGADDYLTKPFTAAELLKTVNARLHKHEIVQEKAEHKMTELRGNLMMALPHELRTPLNVIMGFSDLLMLDADTMEPARVVDVARYINNSAMRLYRLVENYLLYMQLQVLSFNREQRQRILSAGTTGNIKDVIEEQSRLRARDPHPPTQARVDDLQVNAEAAPALKIAEEYVRKIMEELIDNACKFSSPGTPIAVTGERRDHHYAISVRDEGEGMTLDQIDSIGAYMQFERRIREQQGAGLGLIISKQLADLHDGTFTISSTPGKGTTVTITLPFEA